MDAGEILGILGHDLQQIVGRSCHKMTFQNVGNTGNLSLEGVQQVFRLALQRDLDKDGGWLAQSSRIHQRNISRDVAILLKPLDPPVTGGGRQVHPFGKLGIGDAAFFLHCSKNTPVSCVQTFCHGKLSCILAVCSNSLSHPPRMASEKSKHVHRFWPILGAQRPIRAVRESKMKIGCPKEIKPQEFRVGMTPDAAREAIAHGHEVLVETNAGNGAGFSDADYKAVGAKIIGTAEEVFAQADMIVKVKEPQAVERKRLRPGQVLFTYLHLAPDPEQTKDLLASGATCIAYETVTDDRGGLPLLAPMSEVAGRLAPQVGAWTLQKANGGRGVLLGGVPGVSPAKVLVIGGGVVGTHAAKIAAGMGADVTVLDRSINRLRYLDDVFGGQFKNAYASAGNTITLAREADMIIGAVLIPGAAAPKLISKAQLKELKPGAALVDVAIDQGGCFETSRATTHQDPIYEVDGIMHYCVANMPGAVARTSTQALGNATMPFMLALADKGWKKACADDKHLLNGLNVHAGKLTYAAVGEALGLPWISGADALKI